MLIRNFPEKLRYAFKVLCAQENISMNRKVIALIEDAVRKGPKKPPFAKEEK